MTSIFEAVAHDLGHAAHTIETDIASMFGHGEYHAPSSPAPAPEGNPAMSVLAIITEAETVITEAKDEAAKLEANPVFQELLKIAEDTPIPVLQSLAQLIGPTLAALSAAHAATPTA